MNRKTHVRLLYIPYDFTVHIRSILASGSVRRSTLDFIKQRIDLYTRKNKPFEFYVLLELSRDRVSVLCVFNVITCIEYSIQK